MPLEDMLQRGNTLFQPAATVTRPRVAGWMDGLVTSFFVGFYRT